jgi:hypothetical protein
VNQVERAIDYIRQRGSARTPELASLLEIPPDKVDYLLAGPRELGLLITCDVTVGAERVLEYRVTTRPRANGNSHLFTPLQQKTAAGLASAELRRRQPDGPAAPVPVAAPQKEARMLTAAELITASLREHGRSTLDEISKRTRLEKDTISTTLWAMKGVRRVARGTYELGKGKAPAPGKKANKKKSTARRGRALARVDRTPRPAKPPAPADPGSAQFAISECGALGIEKGDTKLSLEGEEFARLRGFIDRTKPIWDQ